MEAWGEKNQGTLVRASSKSERVVPLQQDLDTWDVSCIRFCLSVAERRNWLSVTVLAFLLEVFLPPFPSEAQI